MLIFIIILVILIIALLVTNIRIVPQANAYVIERLGAYMTTWEVGLHIKIPLIDKVAKKVSLKEHVIDFPPQPVITKDNVTMEIDTVIYFQITDPKLYTYGVANPMAAIENLTATTLRNIIGDLELDESLTSREIINSKIRIVLDEATDAWGIKINRVEVKNIVPPRDIQDAMEKQMRAEREEERSHSQSRRRKEIGDPHRRGKQAVYHSESRSRKSGYYSRSRSCQRSCSRGGGRSGGGDPSGAAGDGGRYPDDCGIRSERESHLTEKSGGIYSGS